MLSLLKELLGLLELRRLLLHFGGTVGRLMHRTCLCGMHLRMARMSLLLHLPCWVLRLRLLLRMNMLHLLGLQHCLLRSQCGGRRVALPHIAPALTLTSNPRQHPRRFVHERVHCVAHQALGSGYAAAT